MNTFVNAVINQEARTENGMKARKSTSSAVVDLFFKAGAMRGKDIVPAFTAAMVENEELALRLALWLRDVRGGAGERELLGLGLEHRAEAADIAAGDELERRDDLRHFGSRLHARARRRERARPGADVPNIQLAVERALVTMHKHAPNKNRCHILRTILLQC